MDSSPRFLKLWAGALIAAAATAASAEIVRSTGYEYDNNGNLHSVRVTAFDTACDAVVNTPAMCGSCTNRCPEPANGRATCAVNCTESACSSACNSPPICNSGFDTFCPETNQCVRSYADVANCGACGHVCTWAGQYSASCQNGACVFTCSAGYSMCPTLCAALGSDEDNCGSCGVVCPVPGGGYADCVTGLCAQRCSVPSDVVCRNDAGSNACVNLASNPEACGVCSGSSCDTECVASPWSVVRVDATESGTFGHALRDCALVPTLSWPPPPACSGGFCM